MDTKLSERFRIAAAVMKTAVLLSGVAVGCFAPVQCPAGEAPEAIVLPQHASKLEVLAANEIQRYVYLRTGELLPVRHRPGAGHAIAVGVRSTSFSGELGRDLKPDEFTLRSTSVAGRKTWWVIGGDEVGTLYGAYRFAEKLGVAFGLDEDIVPDERLTTSWPELDETAKPRFALRGLQPFHDFSVGPDWWNLQDYQSLSSQMAKLRLNFLGLHTYPSWNPAAGPEANVWIGPPSEVDAKGNVRAGYKAGVVTTRAGWAVTPFPTSRYASGAGLLFEQDEYGPDYMLDCLDWPTNDAASAAMFNRYGDFQQKAFQHARRLGIKTCVGTEVPLGVPTELLGRLEARGLKTNDPAVIQSLYEGTFLRLKRKIPIDYYWFWAPEIWLGEEPGCPGWEIATRANVERDFRLIEAAAAAAKVPFGFATGGWRLGTRDDASWMDMRTPKTWAASAINTGVGRDPVEKYFGTMKGRSKWVIGWAEDDGSSGAHCCTCWDLQLWAERLFVNSEEALRYGCDGMMAIHWRTSAMEPNIAALSQAGWGFDGPGRDHKNSLSSPGKMSAMDDFWAEWGRARFGGEAGAEAGRILQKLDGSHLVINSLIDSGTKTTDAQISEVFAPLRQLEALRPRLSGSGNLERFDYWCKFIGASELRVRAWVIAARLSSKVKEAETIAGPDAKQSFARKEILPLRIQLARTYEEVIAAFVRCAKSPGEVGTITSIESGSRTRVITAQDAAIEALLGGSLPVEAAIRTAYQGAPRVFASAKRTQMKAREPHEIRAFVLSSQKCTGVNLHWRPLGAQTFKTVPATHRARQAYRVNLPAQAPKTVEYYLEAMLEDGQQVRWPATAPALNQTVIAW